MRDGIESVRTSEQSESASERVSGPRVINEQHRTAKILRSTRVLVKIHLSISLSFFLPPILWTLGQMDDDGSIRGAGEGGGCWRLLA